MDPAAPATPAPRPRSRLDGRWVVAAMLLGYFALLGALIQSTDYSIGWYSLGVPGLKPLFADLRVITAGGDSYRAGFDPLVQNPSDFWQRPMDYPRVWLLPLLVFGIHQTQTVALGVALAAVFLACLFCFVGRLTLGQGLLWGVLLCAPSTMLAVERGNNDLVIFSLLALALVASRRETVRPWLAYLVLGLCAVLKLYPICAFMLAWREKPRRALGILAVAAVVFGAYLFVTRGDLAAINSAVPRGSWLSYGKDVYFTWLGGPGAPGAPPWYASLLAVGAALVLVALLRVRLPEPIVLPRADADGFLVGGALYAATFVASSNYNYRLIMLLLAVPALLRLLHDASAFYRRLAGTMLTAMVVGWWLSPQWASLCFLVKEAANWLLFAGTLFLLLQCLPLRRETWRRETVATV